MNCVILSFIKDIVVWLTKTAARLATRFCLRGRMQRASVFSSAEQRAEGKSDPTEVALAARLMRPVRQQETVLNGKYPADKMEGALKILSMF